MILILIEITILNNSKLINLLYNVSANLLDEKKKEFYIESVTENGTDANNYFSFRCN